MAIIENGYLRGQIGNLVNRKVGTQNVVQTKPTGKIRQTQWTEAAASDFGTASSAGSLIRRAFISAHRRVHDGQMHNRLVKRMQRVLRGSGKTMKGYMQVKDGNIKRLVDFQFNEKCHIYDYIYFDPEVSFDDTGTTHIHLPDFEVHRNFYLPRACSHIVLTIEIKGFHFSQKRYTSIGNHEIELQLYDNAKQIQNAQTLVFDTNGILYDSILVSLSALYIQKHSNHAFLLNNDTLNPAGIIAAFNPKKAQ